MFSRFFQKSPSKQQRQQQKVVNSSFSSADFNPRVLLHYGVPSNASILAFDRIQRLLAVGTLLLIAYENGVMVLWDASEDRIVLIRGYKDTELKRKNVTIFPNDPKDELSDDQLDHEEEDKEICSVSWASSDGSVVVVGYVDGDIMFWDLSTADSPSGQAQKVSKIVIKLQLSSADRRLPVIVLQWCATKSLNNSGGQLFVYGGDEIGSEEVLTVLSLDWSSGIENLKCTGRIDVMLSGSFADMVLLSSDFHTEGACNMLFILSNPGQLDLYDKDCLSSLMSRQEKKTSAPAMQYPMAIPALEPYMTTARLGVVYQDVKSFRALSEILVAAKQHSVQNQTSTGIKWPLTGGVPGQIFKEYHHIIQIYIAGYRDGSIRIWDATYPALSLVYNIKSKVSDIKVGIASAPVSALDFCPDTLHLAVGDESGVVALLDVNSSSVLFLTNTESNTSSALVSLNAKFSDVCSLNIPQESVSDISDSSGKGPVFIMTRDANLVVIDTAKGDVVCSRTMNPKKSDSGIQANIPSENAQVETSTPLENSYLGLIALNSLILLCYETELSLHSLKFVIEVNGNETSVLSLLTRENEFCVLAAAVDVTTSLSPDQNERQGAPGIFINFVKNFKAGTADQNAIQAVHANNLEQIFSYPPFLKPSLDTLDTKDAFELDIDEIHIDEPLVVLYPQKSDIDKRDKGKGTDREKLLEGASTDSKPRARTAEEIKAKYKKTGDASAAAALARDKLVERQEKLQMLSQRTEELQSGAQDFASMAAELAKRMENRKWWQL
ncbi:hypothetical protein TanjilG_18911 [Lupinus angustifolius]|uniref:V-SNARE coiled-coil homology domain-containing protein n=1 Tax=Lupinus angustifolius TaxID=3871 RepID=A0A4P1RQK3_LUPAN|nr:hypothetical protein TanjilG_18911 [Lupinus angustifolius]